MDESGAEKPWPNSQELVITSVSSCFQNIDHERNPNIKQASSSKLALMASAF